MVEGLDSRLSTLLRKIPIYISFTVCHVEVSHLSNWTIMTETKKRNLRSTKSHLQRLLALEAALT